MHGLKRQLIESHKREKAGAEQGATTHLQHVQVHNAPHKIRIRQPGGALHDATEAFMNSAVLLLQRGPIVADLPAGLVRVGHNIRLFESE